MQKEDKVDADLREGQHDQPHWYARGPQQMGLRHDERGDRQQDGEPEPRRLGPIVSHRLILSDTRRPVVKPMIVTFHHPKSPIR